MTIQKFFSIIALLVGLKTIIAHSPLVFISSVHISSDSFSAFGWLIVRLVVWFNHLLWDFQLGII